MLTVDFGMFDLVKLCDIGNFFWDLTVSQRSSRK